MLSSIGERTAAIAPVAILKRKVYMVFFKRRELRIEGRYISLVVGRFGEFSRGFVKLIDCMTRQRTYAYDEHFN